MIAHRLAHAEPRVTCMHACLGRRNILNSIMESEEDHRISLEILAEWNGSALNRTVRGGAPRPSGDTADLSGSDQLRSSAATRPGTPGAGVGVARRIDRRAPAGGEFGVGTQPAGDRDRPARVSRLVARHSRSSLISNP